MAKFNNKGAVGGAASGAAAGSNFGPYGAIIGGVAGGALGGFSGGEKSKPIDITAQLNKLQDTYSKNRQLNQGLTTSLNPLTDKYKADLASALSGAKQDFTGERNNYLTATDANTKEAQDAMRRNLYSTTFNALPDTLQAVREASAAGGGLNTGSYQKAVNDVGRTTAQTIGQGERDIQLAGVNNRQGAQENAFNAFNNLSSKLTDQQINGLTKVMDTGREDLVRQYTTDMGLNADETQGIIDLLNFQASGDMAAHTADEANSSSNLASMLNSAASIYATNRKTGNTSAPKAA